VTWTIDSAERFMLNAGTFDAKSHTINGQLDYSFRMSDPKMTVINDRASFSTSYRWIVPPMP
jgi:hypothetical protein